jgi:hypothetical protein
MVHPFVFADDAEMKREGAEDRDFLCAPFFLFFLCGLCVLCVKPFFSWGRLELCVSWDFAQETGAFGEKARTNTIA